MADEDETKKVTDSKAGELRFTPNPQVWAYLDWLSKHTMLGKTPNEVAQHVLLQRLSEMRDEDYKVDKI